MDDMSNTPYDMIIGSDGLKKQKLTFILTILLYPWIMQVCLGSQEIAKINVTYSMKMQICMKMKHIDEKFLMINMT